MALGFATFILNMGLSFVGIIFIIVGTVGAVFLHCLRRFLNKRSLKGVCEALELPGPGKYSPLKCDALLDRNPSPSSCKHSPQKCDALLDRNPSPSSCLDSYIPTKPKTVLRHEHDYGYLPHSSLPLPPINTSANLLESAFCCAPPPLWLSSSCPPPSPSSCKYSPQKCDALLDRNPSPSSCLDSYIPTKPKTVLRHEHDYGYLPHSSLPLPPINTSANLLESAFCCAPPPLWLSSSCPPPSPSSCKYSPQKCDALLDRNPSPSSCLDSYIPTKPKTVLRHEHDYGYLPHSSLPLPPINTSANLLESAFCCAPPPLWLSSSCAPPPHSSQQEESFSSSCAPPPLSLSTSHNLCFPPHPISSQHDLAESSIAPTDILPCPLESDLFNSAQFYGSVRGTKFSSVMESDRLKSAALKLTMELFNEHLKAMSSVRSSSEKDLADSSGPTDILPCPLESDLFKSVQVRGTKFSSVMESDRLKSATLKLSMELFNEHLKAMSSVPSSTENDLADSSGPTDILPCPLESDLFNSATELSSEQLKEMSSLPSLDVPFTHRYRSDLSSEQLKEMSSLPSLDLPFTDRYRSDLFSPIGPPPMENWHVNRFPSTCSYAIPALVPIGSAVMTESDSAHVVGMAKQTDGLLEFQDQFP